MPSAATRMAREAAAPSFIPAQQPGAAPKEPVAPRVRAASHWFFWVVAASVLDSLFVSLGSKIHRFTGLGAAALVDKWGGSARLHVLANGWVGAGLVLLGFSALEGRRQAFTIGLVVIVCDAALLLMAGDYLSIPFHAFVLYQLYVGFAGLQPSSKTETAPVAEPAAE